MDGFSYRESQWSHSSGYAKKQILAVYVHKNGDSYENTPKCKKGERDLGLVHHDRHAGGPIIKQSASVPNHLRVHCQGLGSNHLWLEIKWYKEQNPTDTVLLQF